MPWQPNVEKWNDDENYDIQEPLWRRLLELASRHGDIKKLQQIISWFNKRNMYGDDYKIVLIGCFLKQAGAGLEEYVGPPYLSVIAEITMDADSIEECAACMLKKQKLNEELIDEFRTQFAGNR